ncbi:MAG: alpha-hydroxy acid oxidase [Steroidobacteraceae bacterium]
MQELINLDDFEQAALPRLPAGVRAYYAGGAGDEQTLAANRRAWSDWDVHDRVLRNVADRSLGTQRLGRPIDWPVLIAPTACQRLAHDDGELATARAAAATATPMVLSTLANHAVDAVSPVASAGLGFQLYVYRDRGVTRELVARARAAGCRALVLTVDMPVAGQRERDVRQQFSLPQHLPLGNLAGLASLATAPAAGAGVIGYVDGLFDPTLGWRDLEWLVAEAGMPVLVKGIVRPDDAVAAVRHGASGVIVSNHGGRQLDGAPATAHVLPRIAAALRPMRAAGASAAQPPALLVDGGIRRGIDVLRALALGADAVLMGRPVLWGLTVGGEHGVRRMLELLRHELSIAMALAGCANVAQISAELVERRA